MPTTLCTTLDSVNPVIYPSIDTILIKLCALLTMPVASATTEMPFSVLRRLKTYVRSTMKNDRLSSLGLMHILTEILKGTCTKQYGGVRICWLDTKGIFWTILRNSCLSKSLK